MSWKFKATSSAGQFEVPPAGLHPAVLVGIIDLGTHEQEYKDNVKGTKVYDRHGLFFVWELTDEKQAGSVKNHVIGKDYSATFSQKSGLRKMIEGWFGKTFEEGQEFDPTTLLGRKCMVNISHTVKGDKSYAKLEGISQVPKGMTVPPNTITPFKWEIGDAMEPLVAALADWVPPYIYGVKILDIINGSKELGGNGVKPMPMAATAPQVPDDEVPF